MPLTVPDINAPLLDWARWYADQGWPVFPCRGKVPLTPHGFHDASSEPWDIDRWWQQWPDANIGSPAGLAWWALDVDPRAGGDDTLFALERQHGVLPHTLLSHTGGGGNHYLWLLPSGGIVNKAPLGAGLDIQGPGSYIILPPSLHPNTGRAYAWDLVDGPDDITPQPAPPWLEAAVCMPTAPSVPLHPVATATDAIQDGSRNTQLAYRAIAMRRAGLSLDSIYAALVSENQRCMPPLDDRELRQIAYSKDSYAPDPVMVVPPAVPSNGARGAPSQSGTAPGAPAWGAPPYVLHFEDVSAIWSRHYALPRWLIQDLIPEGLTYLVGSQKSGKTYLTYSLALALATATLGQRPWLDFFPIMMDGPVFYLSLEDTDNMFWHRVHQLMPGLTQFPKDRFFFQYDPLVPSLGEGLIETLYTQVIKPYQPALLVIDPISYVSGLPPSAKGADQFAAFRKMALPLRAMAAENHVPLVGVEHRRKKSSDDVDIFETQHGTQAKGTIADATLVIVRETADITMHARVRNAREQTLTLGFSFDEQNCATIVYKGSHEGMLDPGQYGGLRQNVLTVLMTTPRPMSMPEILAAVGIPDSKQAKNAAYQVLFRAEKAHEVQKTTRGMWVWSGVNGP